jgi:Fe-S-cluster containining protein
MTCQTCGACCASFRVDFHPAELSGGAFAWGEGVPAALTVSVTSSLVRMKGTDSGYDAPPRCVALAGQIGCEVACTIYTERPGPCREFEEGSDACLRARRRHGLE